MTETHCGSAPRNFNRKDAKSTKNKAALNARAAPLGSLRFALFGPSLIRVQISLNPHRRYIREIAEHAFHAQLFEKDSM